MSYNATACRLPSAGNGAASAKIIMQAERLADLLTEVVEFQDFIHLSREVRLDPEVNKILSLMNDCRSDSLDRNSLRVLQNRLETQPVMRDLRQAEQAMHAIFTAVDASIS